MNWGFLLHACHHTIFEYASVGVGLPLSCVAIVFCTAALKKSIRLREEALAKEQEKPKSSQTSAEKLRKILKEEKR